MRPIRIGASAVHIPHSPEEVFRVESGRVLVYIVPWDGRSAGRRCLLAEASAGDLLPSLVWTGPDSTGWRLCFSSLEGASLLPLPGEDPAPVRERFLALAGVENEPGSFARRLVDLRELLLLKEDTALVSLQEEQASVRRRTDLLLDGALHGKAPLPENEPPAAAPVREKTPRLSPRPAPSPHPQDTSAAYQTLLTLCRLERLTPVDWEKACAALGEDASAPELARLSGIPCREITLSEGWSRADHGVLLVRCEGQWAVCRHCFGCTLHLPGKKPVRLTRAMEKSIPQQAWAVERPLPEGPVGPAALFRFCIRCVRPADLLLFPAGALLSALAALGLPALALLLYDRLLPFARNAVLWRACACALALLLAGMLFGLLKDRCALRIGQMIGHGVRCAAYHRAFALPPSSRRIFDSADLALRTLETAHACALGAQSLLTLLSGLVGLPGALCILLFCSPSAAAACAAVLTACFFIRLAASAASARHAQAASSQDSLASSRLCQFLEAADKLQMSGAQDRAAYEYLKPYARRSAALSRSRTADLIGSCASLFAYLLCAAACFAPFLGTGQTACALLSAAIACAAVSSLSRSAEIWLTSRPERLRAFEFLRLSPEPTIGKRAPGPLTGAIELENVRFSYDGRREILSGIDLSISPGEYIGVVGASGSGKSTLLHLLLGFEQPLSGRILYDGADLSTLDLSLLRSRFGTVLQDCSLISGTILENITLTRPGASAADALEAAKLAGVYEDIMAMPMQLQTLVQENGSTLSGGQTQRILIARALLGRPDILFFDEATGSLDNISQKKVCDTIDSLSCTRVVIAHRLSTLRRCSRILVLHEGRIAEQGTCEELLRKGGLFAALARGQELS